VRGQRARRKKNRGRAYSNLMSSTVHQPAYASGRRTASQQPPTVLLAAAELDKQGLVNHREIRDIGVVD
jgi:hypothetical protein